MEEIVSAKFGYTRLTLRDKLVSAMGAVLVDGTISARQYVRLVRRSRSIAIRR